MQKILSGEKTIESRWYKNKIAPWNRVEPGDTIYFKNSGEEIKVKAQVTKVEQFRIESKKQAFEIMKKYSKQILGSANIPKSVNNYISGKNYTILVHFNKVEKVTPFNIDKTGFGTQAAWLITDDINKLRQSD